MKTTKTINVDNLSYPVGITALFGLSQSESRRTIRRNNVFLNKTLITKDTTQFVSPDELRGKTLHIGKKTTIQLL